MSHIAVHWLKPWHPTGSDPGQIEAIERELRKEVASGHPLFGIQVDAIGWRSDRDDVLFQLRDGTERVAVVHLTWARNGPENPPWPITVLYADFQTWLTVGMLADHVEYTEVG